jgi:hypothetical protein
MVSFSLSMLPYVATPSERLAYKSTLCKSSLTSQKK